MSSDSAPQSGHPETLKVATWNIHEGVPVTPGGDPALELVQFLDGVDLAALQEVALTPDGSFPESGPLDSIGMAQRTTFPMSESAMFTDRRMGVVIASRWRCSEVRRILLPNPGLRVRSGERLLASHDKGLLAVKVHIGERALWFATVHVFPFYKFERDAREPAFGTVWQELADSIGALHELPVLVAGDFNTEHRELLTDKVARNFRRGVTGTRRGVTGTPTYRGIESDDVIYSPELELLRTQVISTFSDHDLCVCEFKFR